MPGNLQSELPYHRCSNPVTEQEYCVDSTVERPLMTTDKSHLVHDGHYKPTSPGTTIALWSEANKTGDPLNPLLGQQGQGIAGPQDAVLDEIKERLDSGPWDSEMRQAVELLIKKLEAQKPSPCQCSELIHVCWKFYSKVNPDSRNLPGQKIEGMGTEQFALANGDLFHDLIKALGRHEEAAQAQEVPAIITYHKLAGKIEKDATKFASDDSKWLLMKDIDEWRKEGKPKEKELQTPFLDRLMLVCSASRNTPVGNALQWIHYYHLRCQVAHNRPPRIADYMHPISTTVNWKQMSSDYESLSNKYELLSDALTRKRSILVSDESNRGPVSTAYARSQLEAVAKWRNSIANEAAFQPPISYRKEYEEGHWDGIPALSEFAAMDD
ncbi:hypothetical protein S40293_10783 [Stachybotrys chartarum IBT 40293]|nr:hypothetical protein S40293_10783 [Stachybotrys chartarum IBT 40293]